MLALLDRLKFQTFPQHAIGRLVFEDVLGQGILRCASAQRPPICKLTREGCYGCCRLRGPSARTGVCLLVNKKLLAYKKTSIFLPAEVHQHNIFGDGRMFLLSFSYRKPEPMPRLTTPTDMTKLTPDDNPYNHPSGHILHAYFMAHVDILGTMPMTVRALDEPGLFDVEVNGMTCRSILTVAVDQGADDIDFDIVSFVVSDIFMCDVTFSYDHNQPHAGMFRIMTSMLEEVFMVRRTAITEALRQHLTMNAQTSPAPGATSPTTDHTSMYQTEIDAAEAQLIATRAVLLADLRVLGVARVEMYYEGYEDSGNVDFINFTPSNVMIAESLNHRVEDFGWDFAYSCNPGFENACGGGGTLYWNLETDSISIEHSDFGEEAEPTLYEGL